MKRLLAAFALASLAAPAFAQTAADQVKEVMTRYVQAFNRGDAPALAKDFYDVPGVSLQETQLKLTEQFGKLRADEFGKMDLYSIKPCVTGPDTAQAEMKFAYIFTFGGAMPPGDQTAIFDLRKTEQGWRIAGSKDEKADFQLACPTS